MSIKDIHSIEVGGYSRPHSSSGVFFCVAVEQQCKFDSVGGGKSIDAVSGRGVVSLSSLKASHSLPQLASIKDIHWIEVGGFSRTHTGVSLCDCV